MQYGKYRLSNTPRRIKLRFSTKSIFPVLINSEVYTIFIATEHWQKTVLECQYIYIYIYIYVFVEPTTDI